MQLVMAYYNNPQMLALHKREWARYRYPVEVILVDDGSTTPPDMGDCPVPYQLYRVLEDRPWHQNGARNLGMAQATDWCLLTDMDHLLTAENLDKIRGLNLERGCAYRPRRVWPDGTDREKRHPNSYLLHRDDFWSAGGYDERWCGYYGTDATFRRQLEAARINLCGTDRFDLVLYEGWLDDAITQGLGRKGSRYHSAQHPKVRQAMKKASKPKRWLQFPWERVA